MTNFVDKVSKGFKKVGKGISHTGKDIGKDVKSVGKTAENAIGTVYKDTMGILKNVTSPWVLIAIAVAIIVLFFSK